MSKQLMPCTTRKKRDYIKWIASTSRSTNCGPVLAPHLQKHPTTYRGSTEPGFQLILRPAQTQTQCFLPDRSSRPKACPTSVVVVHTEVTSLHFFGSNLPHKKLKFDSSHHSFNASRVLERKWNPHALTWRTKSKHRSPRQVCTYVHIRTMRQITASLAWLVYAVPAFGFSTKLCFYII